MDKQKKHFYIGTIICASMILLFLFFRKELPDKVPVQIKSDGTVGNTVPKDVLIFGFPAIFIFINILRSLHLLKEEKVSPVNFYIIPLITVVLSVVMLIMGLSLS